MPELAPVVRMVLEKRRQVPACESVLVALSGIDGAGKGHVAGLTVAALRDLGVNAVAINIDGWHHLPARRFGEERSAEHFYHHAFRFEEMFERLVLPLKRNRAIRVEANLARTEETATTYYAHTYDFADVDVIVLEGIFLLKRAFRQLYDGTMWVNCSFATALERALRRGQEGLPPEETVRAYQSLFFAAQRIHITLDDPQSAANVIVNNDPRLEAPI
jgi:uridine kinase